MDLDIYAEPDPLDADVEKNLGPLRPLVGTWEGDKGLDVAPSRNGPAETPYRERITFEPMGPVANGPQVLYGLRYHTTVWPLGDEAPFHEEAGYWLWDASYEQVMRCFVVPRGVTVQAGGPASPEARSFHLEAEAGSATYGILSNPFLDRAFRTVRYELQVTIQEDGSLFYEEDAVLEIQGQQALFHHVDKNTLRRV